MATRAANLMSVAGDRRAAGRVMTSDGETRIQELKERIARFAREREWDQFHSPKNLSMALAVEAAELMELFQWKTEPETSDIRSDQQAIRRVREEIADVAVYLLNLCNRLDIDLAVAIVDKLAQNARKYPVSLVKGKSTKYSDVSKIEGKRRLATAGEGSTWHQMQLGFQAGQEERAASVPEPPR